MRNSSTLSSPRLTMVTCGSSDSFREPAGGGGGSGIGSSFGGEVCAATLSVTAASRTGIRRRMGCPSGIPLSLSKVKQQFVLFRQWAEAARLVVIEDRRHHALGLVDDLEQIDVFGTDHVLGHQPRAEPVEHPGPELGADQDQRNARA